MDYIKKRQQNIEVLRVIAMLFIVIGHYIYWGINSNPNGEACHSYFDWYSMELLRVITLTAVDLYVFITGYFLIEKTKFRWKGLVKTWGITFFYSIGIWLATYLAGIRDFSIQECLHAFMPITFAKYWFVQKYLGLLLIAPFLSILANQVTKKQYGLLLVVMFFLNFNMPMREPYNSGNVCSLSWFCFLYLAAGFYKLYGIPIVIEKHIMKINILLSVGLVTIFLVANIYMYGNDVTNYKLYGTGPDGLIVILAMAQFVMFAKMAYSGRIWNVIASIAPYTFGVYLIHENRNISNILWWDIMPQSCFWNACQFVHCIVFSVALFIMCVLIDYVRSKIVLIIRNVLNIIKIK